MESPENKPRELAETEAHPAVTAEANTPVEHAVPAWLKMLEEQSYQAELLISGLVVAGLFQLPDLIIKFMGGYLLGSTELGFHYLSMAAVLMLAATNALLFFFAFHFLLRSIWVALLGLNSAYPNGINVNSTAGSGPSYWRKAKEQYPNLSTYNLELDRQCSVIFSLASQTAIMVTAISLLIIVVYLLFDWLIGYFPVVGDYALGIGLGLYLLFTVFSLGLQLLARKYPENKKVEWLVEGYGKVVGGIFSLYVFRKALGYIGGVLVSNATSRYYFVVLMLGGFGMGLVSGIQTGDEPVFRYFRPERYVRFNNQAHDFFAFNYDNLRPPKTPVFAPTIQADVIKGSVLKLFLPTISREKDQMNIRDLSFWERVKYSRSERDSIAAANLKGYAAFNTVLVNDSVYHDLNFQYFYHPHANEKGLLAYISTDHFVKGRNILEIRKQYFLDGVQKIVTIPFYYEPE